MAIYGMEIHVQGTMEEARARVETALKEQGFGVLTEIDVQKTLKEKIGVEFKPYLILGACNPHLAHRALSTDEAIGLLLPCNVVLAQDGDGVRVSIIDPEAMFSVVEAATQQKLADLPLEAKRRLRAVLEMLEARG